MSSRRVLLGATLTLGAAVALAAGLAPAVAQDATDAGAPAVEQQKAQAPTTVAPLQTEITDAAGRVHKRMRKFNRAELLAAAQRLKAKAAAAKPGAKGAARSAAGVRTLTLGAGASGLGIASTSLLPAANGELFPDYSGMTPNWANSPPLRKFVDGLPGLCGMPVGTDQDGTNNLGQCLPVAIPDKTTYENADYYEIELVQYKEQMHSDLPGPFNPISPDPLAGTTLRGYRQTNTTDPNASKAHYLGPVIVAEKGRPVRIKFTNNLPTGAGGNLFIPVDASVMGAGPGPNVSDAARTATPPDVLCPAGPGQTVPPDCYSHNRATIHLHGGVTPWISDGTTHQWITPAGESTDYPKGVSVFNVPDMPNGGKPPVPPAPDPSAGVSTFYYTNDQSARLMFYHDHAAGITRLNVYAGEAAGYLVTDPTEQALMAPGGVLESVGIGIPLVLQDKTFVDAETVLSPQTVLDTDPTWNWGTGAIDPVTGRRQPNTGDLWWPHVYMPAQNPYDLGGANPMGRWHYGPWFWPPTTGIPYGPVTNPYYDPINAPWQPPEVPGTPNPSWGAEAFLDTAVVNGTAYPTLTVEPKAYRFRILDAAHDRFFNLSWFVAADKNTQTTWPVDPLLPPTALCDGAVPPADCTEVKMVNAAPDGAGFPELWPTDGRVGGVPDPLTAGPDWIQIGTEGGFLPMPVQIPAQPVTWNMDPTTFNFGNVQDHSLLLGPAERVDVIVDFSAFAGKTLILYNDAPAAFPALDPHYDYFTGAPDNREIGGADTTPPGMGPNTRTLMQVVVGSGTPQPYSAPLEAEWISLPGHPGVFERSQDPIIVGQTAYDDAYTRTSVPAPAQETFPTTFPYWGYSRIQDNAMGVETVDGSRVTLPLEPKAIQDEMGEVFDDYGRMSAKLGLEMAFTNAGIQTFILQGYADPPTELIKLSASTTPIGAPGADGTQLWKITHNGVDTHPVHFHLFHVQLVNRVGWDGFIRTPDPNELGWKDTVRISPLEDTIVALRPISPRPENLPFKVPNSFRQHEPAFPLGSTLPFVGLDPYTGDAAVISNDVSNYGWEYVWHCHILSHEENDMMRAIVFAETPETPTNLSAFLSTPGGNPQIDLAWTDNSITATGALIHRASTPDFLTDLVELNAGFPACTDALGCARSYTDTSVTGGAYYYRLASSNIVGSAAPYRTITANSAWSNTAEVATPVDVIVTGAVVSPSCSTATYTAVVTNAGPNAVTAGGFSAPLPAAITSATWSCLATGAGACSVPGAGGLGGAYTLDAGESATFTLEATIAASALTVPVTFTATLSAGLVDTNPADNSVTVTLNPPPAGGQFAVWQNAVGVALCGADLVKTAPTGWGNAGASSTLAIGSGDGYAEFTVPPSPQRVMFGLSNGDANLGYTEIDYAFFTNSSVGAIHIYENGAFRASLGAGSLLAGDTLRVAVQGGVVRYYRNGVLRYTSTQAPLMPLRVDTAFDTNGAVVRDAALVGTNLVDVTVPVEAVVWQNLVGVTAGGATLTKTAATGWGNAGASSTRGLNGGGYAEFTVPATPLQVMFGLSNGDANQGYNEIDYAFYSNPGVGAVQIYENGVFRGSLGGGSLVAGDKLRIEVTGGVVRYYRNGVLRYTSTQAPSLPLGVDTAFYTNGAVVQGAVLSGSLVNLTSATEAVVWQTAVGVSEAGTTLTKTAATAWGNAGAASNRGLNGDGYAEFTVPAGAQRVMFGLSNGDTDQGFADIDYAFYTNSAVNAVQIYEQGVFRGSLGVGSIVAGDKLRIGLAAGVVRYYRNGVLAYTSALVQTLPLRVDTAFYNNGAQVQDATLAGMRVNTP